jgi:hypothetical protein
MSNYDTTYHRDGTVTIWDCYDQQWLRTGAPPEALLATLSSAERDRVQLHCAGVRLTSTFRQIGPDRCDMGGCPDQRCAGNIMWVEARRRGGSIQMRSVWSNAGERCYSAAEDADVNELCRLAALA